MDKAFEEFEEDWSIEMEEIPEPREPPTVGASHHQGVDMTTLDKRHGGRHLKCRWSQNFGARNGKDHRGRRSHHGGPRFMRHARCSIFFGALAFVAVVLASLCIHKKSIRSRKQYERLNEVHESAVERNLSDEERNKLYKQVAESSCRQRKALKKQMKAQAPVADNGHRYAYIPPVEAPLLDPQPQPAPVGQPAPQHQPQE